MIAFTNAVVLSRALVPLLGLVIWMFYYLNARLAYRMPRGTRKSVHQLVLVFGSVVIFILQVQLMEHLAPSDVHGDYFKGFVLIEGGGVLVVGFWKAFRERSRSMRLGTSSAAERER